MKPPVDNVSAAEDLAYIRRIMEDTRHTVADRGEGFIIWSVIVLVGLLGTWLIPMKYPGWALGIFWPVLIALGWLVTLLFYRPSRQRATSRSPAGKLTAALWFACTIAIFVIVFAGVPTGIITSLSAIMGIIAAIVGIGVFVNGALMGLGWVRNLAFGWWAGAIAEFFWHGPTALLIYAILIVAFYLVPGLILNRQVRRHRSVARQ